MWEKKPPVKKGICRGNLDKNRKGRIREEEN